ncbi:S53 family peptidase [Kribbella sp.]|uniref:S53 family peptidase n=1 Tax=Kribbella sp. TaxID=1871183 RepID=UPI002D6D0168|nr:protease pro-enzyme activation domain-containing protein [Kribbella sp.]HZX03707.1 protease pro-enzyme activation domain-containing protein [Kribbella sp.]
MIRTVGAMVGCAALVAGGASVDAQAGTAAKQTIQVWLTPDLAGAERFATAVSTPGNPLYRHYLSPAEYTARFGPSAAEAKAMADQLTARGLTDVQVSSDRSYISASGPAAKVQSLPPMALGITGLGGASSASAQTAQTAKPTCSQYWGQHVQTVKPAYRGLTTASLPICGYSAAQLRTAYGASPAFTGKGQTVALTESLAPTEMLKTLREYARRNHLPAPKTNQYKEIHLGGGTGCSQQSRSAAPYNDEAEMDSEAVYAMAPDAQQLMIVGGGCDEDQALLNAVAAVLKGDGHRPSASIVSNSWQIPIGDVPPKTVHALAVRAAAEGVGLYFSSGDTPGLTTTASDPFVTAVGGTTLGLDARNKRLFETGWSNETAIPENGKWSGVGLTSGGGGTSLVYGQPAYQKGVVPASMSHIRVGGRTVVDRTVPDISAVGDIDTGMLTGYTDSESKRYVTQVNAGTSLSAPLVAGLVANAQQGRPAFGFINPLIYRLHGTPALRDVLSLPATTPQQNRAAFTPADGTDSASLDVFDSHDRAETDQVTVKGYDTLTGVGTPNGLPFILGLRVTSSLG